MRISGQLLEVQHQSGSFASDRDGSQVNWENVTLRIFDGREVIVIKAKRDAVHAALGLQSLQGEKVTIDVDSPRQVETRALALIKEPVKA
jgi:hypothetical protein